MTKGGGHTGLYLERSEQEGGQIKEKPKAVLKGIQRMEQEAGKVELCSPCVRFLPIESLSHPRDCMQMSVFQGNLKLIWDSPPATRQE